MMIYLLAAAFLFALIEWIGEYKKNDSLIFFSKPLVLILLLVWSLTQINFSDLNLVAYDFPIIWFFSGLFFCLIGDIFLMFPDKYLVPGVLFFLLGHVFYIMGFGLLVPPFYNLIPGVIVFMMICLVSTTVYLKIRKGLITSDEEKLIFPFAIYSIVISIMLYTALLTLVDREWNYIPALFVSIGALSFYISDIMYAWARFVEKIPSGRLKVMITYHLAQIAIAVGAVLHYIYPPET